VTRAFNSELSDLFGGPVLRSMGSMVFVEAARAFDPLEDVEPAARPDITLLRASAPASWREDFLAGKGPIPKPSRYSNRL
jgi:hypothetical protein